MLDFWKMWNNFQMSVTHRFLTLLCNAVRKSCRPSSVWQEIRQTGGSPETCPSSLSRFCLWTWGNMSVLFSTRRTLSAGTTIEPRVEQWGNGSVCENSDIFGTNSIDTFVVPVSGCSWRERTLCRWRLRNCAASGALEGRWAQSTTTRVKSACSNLKEKMIRSRLKHTGLS